MLLSAFPDFRLDLADEIAETNQVVSRWTLRGTHAGVFLGIPPTGLSVTCHGSTFFRLSDGKIVEMTRFMDAEALKRLLASSDRRHAER